MFRCATVLVCLAATTLLLIPRPADAQYFGRNKVQNGRLEFRTLQTEHFDIYYYPEEEQVTRQAARMAERWYARYSELLDDSFTHRQAIVFYASHPDFTQTNVSAGTVDEGTGGFTERVKSRIVMPFAPGLGETDHVLGHELAHAFQIDIAKREHQNAFDVAGVVHRRDGRVPLTRSVEHVHEHVAARRQAASPAADDRAAREPALLSLSVRPCVLVVPRRALRRRHRRQAAAFEGARRRRATRGRDRQDARRADPRLARIDCDRGAAAPEMAVTPRAIVTSADGGRVHVAPAISPDGRRIMFISERDRLSLDLFMADAASGARDEEGDQHGGGSAFRQPSVHPLRRRVGRHRASIRRGRPHRRRAVVEHRRHQRHAAAARHPVARRRGDLQPELVSGRKADRLFGDEGRHLGPVRLHPGRQRADTAHRRRVRGPSSIVVAGRKDDRVRLRSLHDVARRAAVRHRSRGAARRGDQDRPSAHGGGRRRKADQSAVVSRRQGRVLRRGSRRRQQRLSRRACVGRHPAGHVGERRRQRHHGHQPGARGRFVQREARVQRLS